MQYYIGKEKESVCICGCKHLRESPLTFCLKELNWCNAIYGSYQSIAGVVNAHCLFVSGRTIKMLEFIHGTVKNINFLLFYWELRINIEIMKHLLLKSHLFADTCFLLLFLPPKQN